MASAEGEPRGAATVARAQAVAVGGAQSPTQVTNTDESGGIATSQATPLSVNAKRSELFAWLGIAWPVAVAMGCRLSMSVVDLMYVGHLGVEELAGASIASVGGVAM